ncbi:MAG: hypothetical protein ACRCVV_22210 [Shewanella sp.]|uniref:hypothetical protein n=1 Tax=Aeromonas popoffii TaxID=70856 RepID=UPI003F3EC0C0
MSEQQQPRDYEAELAAVNANKAEIINEKRAIQAELQAIKAQSGEVATSYELLTSRLMKEDKQRIIDGICKEMFVADAHGFMAELIGGRIEMQMKDGYPTPVINGDVKLTLDDLRKEFSDMTKYGRMLRGNQASGAGGQPQPVGFGGSGSGLVSNGNAHNGFGIR